MIFFFESLSIICCKKYKEYDGYLHEQQKPSIIFMRLFNKQGRVELRGKPASIMGTFGFDLRNSVILDTLMFDLDIITSFGIEGEM